MMKPQVLAIQSETARQLSELISRRRQLVEMQTAEKNRRSRTRGQALADIEAPQNLAQRSPVASMLRVPVFC
ncbi:MULTISPECIES: hypothetical protein [unclassified Nostoc]|uniref:hypothetical protein n=1 Tax=unclassified Nostoc TaxID=2593658 RepID=UPI0025CF85B0|nr:MULTISPECIES: hypothetical protein [unclassified Nostoc]